MASFSIDDFVGNGVLKELLPKLLEEGWDDVPTLKIMNSEDMDALNMTQYQKDAMELRSYLHDRALMQYGDKLEASGKVLSELLSLTIKDLSSQFEMKRGHVVRFINNTSARKDPLPTQNALPARKMTSKLYRNEGNFRSFGSASTMKAKGMSKSYTGSFMNYDKQLEQSLADLEIRDGYIFKGKVAAGPPAPRACGCLQPPPVVDEVAPYSVLENISIQKLTPEYKIGMQRLVKTKTPPMKASELWHHKPAVLLCIRRPGCIMCRAEAYQLYAKKPLFDALGVQLYAVLHEHIESEVNNFWPRYWGGVVLFDRGMEFFKALGGAQLLKDKFISGFVLNPQAIANYRHTKALGADHNFKGEGEIKGGLLLLAEERAALHTSLLRETSAIGLL